MKLRDFERLKKLMMMTMSGADAERAFALKQANDLLEREGLDWDRVLNRTVTVINEFEPAPEEDPGADQAALRTRVEAAFAAIEASDPRGSFADFVASLREQWDKRGSLSAAQLDALFKSAKRAEDRR